MRADRKELGVWWFLMSTAYGAGLMVAPVLLATDGSSVEEHDHAISDMSLGSLSIAETGLAIMLHVGR